MHLIFSFWPLFAIGQVTTGFESGLGVEWDQFPINRWESSPDQALSGLNSLHHSFDNTLSGTDRISFKPGTFDTQRFISWEFTLLHSYLPSSTNNWQVFLASDKGASSAGSAGSLNAYVIGVNLSGSDDILSLYSVQDGRLLKLCQSTLNYENDIGTSAFHCLIKRDSAANWEIYGAKKDSALKFIGAAHEPDYQFPALKHFMISYSYTSTKDRMLWFDDLSIYANFLVDTIPPEIKNCRILSPNSISLELSEQIDTGSIKTEQIRLIPGNIVPSGLRILGKEILCSFSEEFRQGCSYQLIAEKLMDSEGNLKTTDSIEFLYYKAGRDDLVITEIMADPSPPVYLRESEYIELYNRCPFPVNLDSFILQTGKKDWQFPEYVLNPGAYLVVTNGTESGYNTLPIFTSASVITNDGQQIFLKNKAKEIITASEFYSDWYGDDFKSQGGWSLERIDLNNLCGGKENWKASEDSNGGTPGSENSVLAVVPDISSPTIDRLEYINEYKIRLVFSENIDPNTIPGPDSFVLEPDSMRIDSVTIPSFFCSSAELKFKNPLEMGKIYRLTVPELINDCAGNPIEITGGNRIGLPSAAKFTDIIISEIMFSTLPGCPEYIEIYNLSDQLLDLSDLRISVSQPGETGTPVIPLSKSVLFFPGEYLVLCKDKQSLLSCHTIPDPGRVIEVSNMPSLTDAGACIRLINRSLESVDIFCYVPEDQFPMLTDMHGVSLERLTMDRKTGDESFWHSASSVSGFATPGEVNSQFLTGVTVQKTFELIPEIFSPNNDGKDDMLEIHYSIDKEGFVGTVAIYDASGRLLSLLGENEILGTSGMFLWDGRDNNGNICNTGLYLIYAQIWNLKGEKEKFKKSVVLVRE
jgi:hypothetical protein